MWTLMIWILACPVQNCYDFRIEFATYRSEDACIKAGEGLTLYRGNKVERFRCCRQQEKCDAS